MSSSLGFALEEAHRGMAVFGSERASLAPAVGRDDDKLCSRKVSNALELSADDLNIPLLLSATTKYLPEGCQTTSTVCSDLSA